MSVPAGPIWEEILHRIHARFSLILRNEMLDLDYLLDVAQQELSLATVASHHLNIPLELINSLQKLINTLSVPVETAEESLVNVSDIVTATVGMHGRPCLQIDADDLKSLLSTAFPCRRFSQVVWCFKKNTQQADERTWPLSPWMLFQNIWWWTWSCCEVYRLLGIDWWKVSC